MSDDEGMRHALGLASGHLPEPDLAERTWRRGRGVRRQRLVSRVVGAVAAVAVVAAGWDAMGERVDVAPAGQQVEVYPPAVGPMDGLEIPDTPRHEEAVRLWAGLGASCLRARGMEAWLTEDGKGIASRRPEVPGLPGLEASQRWCDSTLVLVLPDPAEETARRAAVREASERRSQLPTPAPVEPEPEELIHLAYSRTATCLAHNGLPAEAPPALATFAEEMLDLNAPIIPGRSVLPTWHPYAAVLAEEGEVKEALEVCPVDRYLVEEWPDRRSQLVPEP